MSITRRELEPWLQATTAEVLKLLELRAKHHAERSEQSTFNRMKTERYDLLRHHLEKMRQSPRDVTGRPSDLERIIRGYLIEFVRQSEEGMPSLNNAGKAYQEFWENRPLQEHETTRFMNMAHTGAAFSRLKGPDNRDFLAMDLCGEIIEVCIKVFHKEFPSLNPAIEPRSSAIRSYHGIHHAQRMLKKLGEDSGKSR
jgi:hypothetical protein